MVALTFFATWAFFASVGYAIDLTFGDTGRFFLLMFLGMGLLAALLAAAIVASAP